MNQIKIFSDGELNFIELFNLFFRERKSLLITFSLSLLIYVLLFFIQPISYTSTSLLSINQDYEDPEVGIQFNPAPLSFGNFDDPFSEHIHILRSYEFQKDIINMSEYRNSKPLNFSELILGYDEARQASLFNRFNNTIFNIRQDDSKILELSIKHYDSEKSVSLLQELITKYNNFYREKEAKIVDKKLEYFDKTISMEPNNNTQYFISEIFSEQLKRKSYLEAEIEILKTVTNPSTPLTDNRKGFLFFLFLIILTGFFAHLSFIIFKNKRLFL